MPGIKEIRVKIASFKSTQKITKAMKMVAASKMRKAQDRMRATRPYAEKIRRVIGHLPEPLIEPDEHEREGYVPNVVYTCGAIVHGERLVVPYGFSDAGIAIAHVALGDLLEALVANGGAAALRTG